MIMTYIIVGAILILISSVKLYTSDKERMKVCLLDWKWHAISIISIITWPILIVSIIIDMNRGKND